MKHRTRENVKFWNKKITDLFTRNPSAQLVEKRWNVVRYLLIDVHPELKGIEKEKMIDILKNADYISRKMRYLTEGQQKELKQTLEIEFMKNL